MAPSWPATCAGDERKAGLGKRGRLGDGAIVTAADGGIGEAFESLARRQPAAPALQVRGRVALTYYELGAQVRYVRTRLSAWGIRPGDIVAGFAASRPEMAVVSASFPSSSTFAPLSPSLPREAYADLLKRLRPKAVLVPEREEHALVAAARELGLAEIRVSSEPDARAGQFTLHLSRSSPSLDATAQTTSPGAYILVSSGTTGRPKLVPVEHDHVLGHASVMRDWLRLTPDDVGCHLVPMHLAHGVRNGLIVPLLAGQSVVCLEESDVDGFFRSFDDFRPTYLTAGFTIYRELLSRAADHRERLAHGRLRFLRIGAGRLEPEEIDRIEQVFAVPALKGLTLSEGAATQDPLPPGVRKIGALGVPLGNELAIMRATGEFEPAGSSGEIVIRGPLVFRGYLDDPELTAQSFADGWFRTGDVGYVDEDGYLYHTGRMKEMINRGGEKFSPLQIDAALESLQGVREAASFGVAHPRLGEEVVAAVVREESARIDEEDLIERAKSRLGPKGVPRRIFFVDRLPRNDGGKLRRAELPRLLGLQPDGRSSDQGLTGSIGPWSPLEIAVGALFAATLGQRVGLHDDFFLAGGDSLNGARLITQVHSAFGVELPARVLFDEAATVAGMARVIERLRSAGASGVPGAGDRPAPRPRSSMRRPAALSPTQRRAWFLWRLNQANPAYNEVRVYRLVGPVAVAALRESLEVVTQRHEILRTTYSMIDGEPRQLVDDRVAPHLELADLSGHSALGDREAALKELLGTTAAHRFDLETGPLARYLLVRLADSEYVLMRVWQHIVCDGWSAAVFERELSAAYNARLGNRSPALPELPLQYADYAAWQLERSGSEPLRRQLEYWKAKLADLPTLRLPSDRTRPAAQSYRGARIEAQLPQELTDALAALGRSAGATPFMSMLAAFYVLLHRYSGEEDIAVGTPIAARTRAEFEGLIGFFANTLVLRVDLTEQPTFLELLERVRETALDAYTHQDLPFERLVEELSPRRDPSRNPLFQVGFAMQTTPLTELALDGVQVQRISPPTGYVKFDLTLTLHPGERGLSASWEYCADLFAAETIERVAGHFERLLTEIAADPSQSIGRIPLLTTAERRTLLDEWSGAPAAYPERATVPELFEAQAAATPDAIALLDAARTVSYRELNARANRLAHYLSARGVEAGQRVGVCIERSPGLIVALLAILKVGAAYVPLDPELPPERLCFLLRDARASLVLARQRRLAQLGDSPCPVLCLDREREAIAAHSADEGRRCGDPDDVAYVMYTSGSTGAPKGVLIPHRAIVRLVRGTNYVQLGGGDVVAHLSNPAFDASTFEIWGALLNGARVALVPRSTVLSPPALADALDRHAVTTLFLTTALFNLLAREAPGTLAGLRHVLFGGEAADPRAVDAVLREGRPERLIHVYGPTETTTFATWHPVSAVDVDAMTVPIGRPIANTQVYILDRYGEPTPVGVAGEIHIGGPGLALGYLGEQALTAERFIPHLFDRAPGARLYRSGDRARYRADGAIELLGRLDRQVKIRGHRVEPGELEAALLRLPPIREAAVVVEGSSAETRQLTAYVVGMPGAEPASAEIWSELRRTLPQYMLPAAIVVLDSLPLTSQGKIDRRALPQPGPSAERRTGRHAPPRDPLQHMLAAIWEEILGVRKIGIHDSFFELGGHSLLAAQMMDAVERACGRSVPLTTLFGTATIAALAGALAGKANRSREPVAAVNAAGTRPPFFFLHGDFSGGGFYSRELARALGPDQPFYAVHPHGLIDAEVPETIEAMAADRLRSVRRLRPNGPYAFGGHCNGALVAFEMARLLLAEGESVPMLIVMDAKAPWRATRVFPGVSIGQERAKSPRVAAAPAASPLSRDEKASTRYRRAMAHYRPVPYSGRLAVLRSEAQLDLRPSLGWSGLATIVETHVIPGDHHTSITRHVAATGARIKACLDAAFEQAGLC